MKIFKPTFQDKNGNTRETEHYYLRHRSRRYPLHVSDLRVAETKARALIATLELGKDPARVDKAKNSAIRALVNLFVSEIRPNASEHHRTLYKARLIKVITGTKASTLAQFTAEKVKRWLVNAKIALRTKQHYTRALKQFGKWLALRGDTAGNVFETLPAITGIEAGRVLERRALTEDEIDKLLASTAKLKRRRCRLRGPDRVMLYRVVMATGFRREEVGSLTRRSFHLDASPPYVEVAAKDTKNKQAAFQPLPQQLADDLKEWLEGKPKDPTRPVFPISGMKTAKMLRADLKAAGIEVKKNGRVVDFHALRTTFGTRMALANVPLALAQRLMRHSDPRLTASVYTVAQLSDLAREVEKL
jgi:site-specific recombinase XerD